MTNLPQGAFDWETLLVFAGYSYVTSMPVLAFKLFISSRFENLWVPLGLGGAGFLTGMAFAAMDERLFLLHPFVLMLKPAVAMSARADTAVCVVSLFEAALFLTAGLWAAQNMRCE